MKRLLLFILVCSAAAAAQNMPASQTVRCGKLLDVRSGRMLTDQLVSFDKDGVITSVGPMPTVQAHATLLPIDLSRATCLPGLIDVHTHITSNPQNSGYRRLGVTIPQQTVIGVVNARKTLLAGFTSIRNVGADDYTDIAIRDAIAEGTLDGPRMRASGRRWASPADTATTTCCLRNSTSKMKALPMARGKPAPRCARW